MVYLSPIWRRVLGCCAFLFGPIVFSGVAQAATFDVTNLNDTGAGSLRQAIIDTNASPGADVITCSASGDIALKTALPTLSDVTINGPTNSTIGLNVKRDSSAQFRIFTVPVGATVTLRNLSIRDGSVAGFGGGINNSGTLSLIACNVFNNSAGRDGGGLSNYHGKVHISDCWFGYNIATGNGGALCNDARTDSSGSAQGPAAMTVVGSIFYGNAAGAEGGGIANYEGTLSIEISTIGSNRALRLGGGFFTAGATANVSIVTLYDNQATEGGGFYSQSETRLANCTLSGNIATRRGGGLSNNYLLTSVDSCTITNNKAPVGQGAGAVSIGDDGGTVTRFANSILAGNLTLDGRPGSDFAYDGMIGNFESSGYNILGSGNDSFEHDTDKSGVTASQLKLGPLRHNDGYNQTHALLMGSPAIDAGNTSLTTDQRRLRRPMGIADDIGAFETEGTQPMVTVTSPTGGQVIPVNSWSSISGSAKDNVGIAGVRFKLFRTRNGVRTYWNGTSFGSAAVLLNANLPSYGSTNATWSYSVPAALREAVDAGAYTIYAYATDMAGNTCPAYGRNFTISVGDDVKPTVTVTNPTGGQVFVASSWSSIGGGAKDNLGVAGVQFKLFRTRNGVKTYWNGSSFGSAAVMINAKVASPSKTSTSWSYSIPASLRTAVDSGTYTLYVYATDVSGNMCPAYGRNFSVTRAQDQEVAPLSETDSPSAASS